MHPEHEKFASQPVLCGLGELFMRLDQMEDRERHFVLGPAYREFFRTEHFHAPHARSEEEGMRSLYQQFQQRAYSLNHQLMEVQLVTLIVMTALVWLDWLSKDENLKSFLESNRRTKIDIGEKSARGEISKEQADYEVREIEERINNLYADMNIRRDTYARFCEKVVAPISNWRPA